MQYTFVAAALAATFAVSHAQLDPSTVPLSTRTFWCQSQITQCPLICTQETDGSAATEANSCEPQNLNYACVCVNGLSPNASEYSQTIPYFICTESNNNCVKNCGLNNNACAAACTQNNPCGAQNPKRVNVTSTASATPSNTNAAATTASDGVVYSGFGGSSESSSNSNTKTGAATMLAVGEIYGLAIIAGGLVAGFATLL